VKVLIIHHLEPCWNSGYQSKGESFESLQEKFIEFLNENSFTKVILTRFEDWTAKIEDGYFHEFLEKVSRVYDYAYGWEWEQFAEYTPDEIEVCEGGNHSQCVLIADWMHELKGADVTISGAFDGECIEDLEIALNHLEIPFTREESLIL
jgi:hypothetical protein